MINNARLEITAIRLIIDVKSFIILRNTEQSFVVHTSIKVHVHIKNFAPSLIQNKNWKSTSLKIWRRTLTSTCSTSKLFGVLIQRTTTRWLRTEQTAFSPIIGRTSEDVRSSLSSTPCFSAKTGRRKSFWRLLRTAVGTSTSVRLPTDRKRFTTRPLTRPPSVSLERAVPRSTVPFSTLNLRREIRFQLAFFTSQSHEEVFNRKTFSSSNI